MDRQRNPSDDERRDEALRRALNTPPKPHKKGEAIGDEPVASPKPRRESKPDV